MPDVVGLSSDEAYARLEAAGLVYFAALREVSEPGVEDDTIGAIFPAPQTMRPLGLKVTFSSEAVVSSGCENPNALYSPGVRRYSLKRIFFLPPDATKIYPTENCSDYTKHDVLTFVADFSREDSTPVYPAMLVQLVEFVSMDYMQTNIGYFPNETIVFVSQISRKDVRRQPV